MSDSARGVLLRFAPMIYGPTVLFAIGEGAVVPLIPVVANRMGADLALSGLIASMLVIGQVCGNLPAGWVVARAGERLTMAGAGTLALLGVIALVFAPNLTVFTIAVFVIGFCAAAFGLARHAFMTTRVPFSFRARALSLLGGSFRFGMFVGPFAAALLLGITGSESSAVWCFAVCLVACVLLVLLGPDPERELASEGAASAASAARAEFAGGVEDTGEAVTGRIGLPVDGSKARPDGIFRTMVTYRRVLSRLGVAAALLAAVRSARQVVLPIWGLSIGLDAHTISLVVGVAGGIDFALFYASGQVMDRFGRLWAALPAMVLMGVGFLALGATHDVPNASMWFAMLAAVIGVGNGLSSGILMTLGADLAPQREPAAFLGSWRTLTDSGGAVAPLLFSGLAAVVTLGAATAAIGVIGLLGALGFLRWIPRFVRR
ncbi:MAG: MFS transporter [Leucobacter sp.]|nr:MFS transporter [Leucobacter sp.]